jgi:uncharacterized membrane protein
VREGLSNGQSVSSASRVNSPREYDDAISDETPETQEAPQRRRRRIRTQRLEAFSDGVFAIAVTLLVLDLVAPPASTGDLLAAFLNQWPAYLAYLVSFSTIGALWLEHSLITEYLEQADPVFVRLNLLLLLIVSFLPFPTRLLAEFLSAEEAEKVAVTIYGLTLLAALLQLSLLWRYAVREHLVRVDVAEDELTILTRRLTPGLVVISSCSCLACPSRPLR